MLRKQYMHVRASATALHSLPALFHVSSHASAHDVLPGLTGCGHWITCAVLSLGTAAALASLHPSGGAHVLKAPAQRATIPKQPAFPEHGELAPASRAVLPAGAPSQPNPTTSLNPQALPPAAEPGSAARAGPSGTAQGPERPAAPSALALAPGAARGAAVEAGEAPFLPYSPGAFTPAALTPSFWWGTATAAYQVRPERVPGF